jgi:hypothetical protein
LGNNFGKWGIAPEVNYGCDIRFTGDAKGKAIEVRTQAAQGTFYRGYEGEDSALLRTGFDGCFGGRLLRCCHRGLFIRSEL